MDWLKGIMGSTDQMVPAGQMPGGGLPAWTPPYATPQGAPGAAPAWGPPGGAPAAMPGSPMAPAPGWTPAMASPAAGAPAWTAASAPVPAAPEARVAILEARCDELRRDMESIALFARTMLTLLEEKQIITQSQFQETKQKLDLLDGKLDDRMG
jgi:hypothetical protein